MNHPDSKGYKFIDCPKHKYIKELKDVLILFEKWRKATEEDKNQCAFSSLEIYTDLCWIVYGLKGVAMFYLDDDGRWSTVQLMGGVDDEEHVFSHQRGKHYDPTIRDCNQTLGRDAGLKSNTFSMRLKASTGV